MNFINSCTFCHLRIFNTTASRSLGRWKHWRSQDATIFYLRQNWLPLRGWSFQGQQESFDMDLDEIKDIFFVETLRKTAKNGCK